MNWKSLRTAGFTLLGLAVLVAAFPLGFAANEAPQSAGPKINYPKLNPIQMPAIQRATLPNGVKLLLIEDHQLPQIGFRALLPGGRLAEPAGKFGLSDLVGEVLRTGGTKNHSGDQLDQMLERIGAGVESGAGLDQLNVNGSALTEHLDKVLPLFAEVIRQPIFAQEKIDLAKEQFRAMIARRNDSPQQIQGREFEILLYGPDSPQARPLEYADLDRLTRDDLIAYHQNVFRPDQLTIAVWGDFQPDQIKDKLNQLLGDWKAAGPAPKYKKPGILPAQASVNFIEKKDVEQTFITLGQPGLRLDDPDTPAVDMMTEILGGGFASRIFRKVRTEKGLAYGAGGYSAPDFDTEGSFRFYTSTKPGSTAEAIQTILDEIKKIREKPVEDWELKMAKDGFLNRFVFQFDQKSEVVNRVMNYEFYGYPADFNTRFKAAIEKVTKEDVLRVAQKYLQPDKLVLLAIGKQEQFDKPLSNFGAVKTIDITIPEPKVEIPAATPETLAQGKAILTTLAKGRGRALVGVREITETGKMAMDSKMGPQNLEYRSVIALPDREWMELTFSGMKVEMVVTPSVAFQKLGPQMMDMPGSQADEMRGSMVYGHGCLLLLQKVLNGQVEAQALGFGEFEGKKAQTVVVRQGGKPATLFVSEDGQTLYGMKMTVSGEKGPEELLTVFSNFKEFGGVLVPTDTVVKAGGKVRMQNLLSDMTINAGADPKLFEKPQQ